MKFGLKNIRALLRSIGNPERSFLSIHVAGSNGKGSTASMIAAILTAAGYRTGLYTSPHLVSFTERIRINGRPISQEAVRTGVETLRKEVVGKQATFFEAVTAIAFWYFRKQRIEIAVIETGLGGRLDATNVVRPIASVITSISREHTQVLGTLIGQVAFEKGGIIKKNVPCYSGVDSGKAARVLSAIAKQRHAPLKNHQGWKIKLLRDSLEGSVVAIVRPDGSSLQNVKLGLSGTHQLSNALLAFRVVEDLAQRGNIRLAEGSVRRGLEHVQELTGIRARLSKIRNHPDVVTDVAHNPAAVSALAHALHRLGWSKSVVVFGVMKDKNYRAMIDALRPLVAAVIVVQPRTERSLPASVLSREFKKRNIPVLFQGGVEEGVLRGIKSVGRQGRLLVTGSHFVVGETLALFEGKNYLTINQ